MEGSAGRISTKVSLEGTKDLYLIVVGIGITEALMHGAGVVRPLQAIPYCLLLIGYLLTVFRFSLGMINLLGHVAERFHRFWTQVVFMVALAFLCCGLCFFWMGHFLQKIPMFLITGLALWLADWATLFLSHKPWHPPRGWGWWMLGKSLAIFFWYPGGWYDPAKDKLHYWPLSHEEILVKSTHYQWIRGTFWLIVIFTAGLFAWNTWQADPHVVWQKLTGVQLKTMAFQAVLGLALITFSIWDLVVNRAYYFGADEEKAASSGL